MKKLVTMMAMASISMMAMAQNELSSGLNKADFDTSVRAADDFYAYACGGWMKNNPLPAAYSRYGSFDRLQEDNDKRINSILKELDELLMQPENASDMVLVTEYTQTKQALDEEVERWEKLSEELELIQNQ